MSKSQAKITFRVSGSTFAPLRLCVIFFLLLANVFTVIEIASAQEPTPAENLPQRRPIRRHRPRQTGGATSCSPTAKPDTPADPARMINFPSTRPASPIVSSGWKKSSADSPSCRPPRDPRRAKLLRDAIAQSREQDINVRFESIVKLLQDERLSAASTNQTDLQKAARRPAHAPAQGRSRQRAHFAARAHPEVHQGSQPTDSRAERRPCPHRGRRRPEVLGDDQQRIATDTGKLGGNISKTDGDKNSGGEKKSGDQNKADKKSEPSEKPGDKPGDKKSTTKKPATTNRQSPTTSKSPATPNPASRPTPISPPKAIRPANRTTAHPPRSARQTEQVDAIAIAADSWPAGLAIAQ